MKELRILIVRSTSFSSEPEHLPNHLRVLDWEEYPSRSFPSRFHPKKTIVFNLRASHLTLEEQFKKFPCLIYMDFSYNQSITKRPDVSQKPNCGSRIHWISLKSFSFKRFRMHQTQKISAKNVSTLSRSLDLDLCVRLEHFPEIMQEMNKPLKIDMINTTIQKLPESICSFTGFVCIDISNSRKFQYLPSSLFMIFSTSTRSYTFGNGNLSDEDLAILYCFPKLEELIVLENNFVSLLACIKECHHLTILNANGCRKLQKILQCIN
ncbi:TMV resistance protein N, partial [Mucuna pruriens]